MKTIIFVRRAPALRVYNQALVLKKTNKYKLVFIGQTAIDQNTLRMFNKVFDKVMFYQPLDFQYWLGKIKQSPVRYLMKHGVLRLADDEMRYLSERIKLPAIIKHFDADGFNCLVKPYELVNQVMKHANCHIILDAYDFDGMYKGVEKLSKSLYEREKYCFESAGGVIHRGPGFEIDYYKSHGYEITCPTLSFLDYCNKEFFVNRNIKKLSSEDNEWHIVHIGSALSPLFMSLPKKLAKQKIHLHIYPTPTSVAPIAFKNLIKLNKTEKYFHLENTVPYDRVNHEIAKYDFGAHFHLTSMSEIGLKVSHCHRVFNYLEAGLPVIVSDRLELIKKTVVENKVGFSVKDEDFSELHNIIEKYDYEELRKNVLRAREKLLIDNHAERLIKFYDNITQR